MESSMVVAHSRATADGRTLLGHNSTRPAGEPQSLVRVPGRRRDSRAGQELHVQAGFLTFPIE